MSAHLDNTFGAAYIGMVFAAVLYGISCVQAFYYYTNQNDRWHIKLIVTAVMIMDTVHQALISHTVYTYTITDWGDPVQLGLIVWSLMAEIVFVGITALVVQIFLTLRIWRLSGNIYLTVIPAILAAGLFLTLIIGTAKSLPMKTLAELVTTKDYTIAVTVLGAATDILIAATLCTLLHISRTGFHKSEVIINRLIVFTVNTGLLTSLCALGCLISVLVAGNTLIYVTFFFCLGRLYTNTLLATLNARQIVLRDVNGAGSTDISYQLRGFQKNVSNQTQNLSINIDTSTETYQSNNQQLKEESRLSPYDEESTNKVPC